MSLLSTLIFLINTIIVVVGLSLLMHRFQSWYVRKNGRITPAKITKIRDTGITIGAGTSTGQIPGKRHWVQLELKLENSLPAWLVSPPIATVKLHPNDLVALTPGLRINVYYHPNFRRIAFIADWGERQAVMPQP